MSRTQAIALINDGILCTYMLIHVRAGADEWQISTIELYADPDHTVLLADDIELARLPRSTQDSVIAALNAWDHAQRQKSRQLAMFGASISALVSA
jgi:hypothetical protein